MKLLLTAIFTLLFMAIANTAQAQECTRENAFRSGKKIKFCVVDGQFYRKYRRGPWRKIKDLNSHWRTQNAVRYYARTRPEFAKTYGISEDPKAKIPTDENGQLVNLDTNKVAAKKREKRIEEEAKDKAKQEKIDKLKAKDVPECLGFENRVVNANDSAKIRIVQQAFAEYILELKKSGKINKLRKALGLKENAPLPFKESTNRKGTFIFKGGYVAPSPSSSCKHVRIGKTNNYKVSCFLKNRQACHRRKKVAFKAMRVEEQKANAGIMYPEHATKTYRDPTVRGGK